MISTNDISMIKNVCPFILIKIHIMFCAHFLLNTMITIHFANILRSHFTLGLSSSFCRQWFRAITYLLFDWMIFLNFYHTDHWNRHKSVFLSYLYMEHSLFSTKIDEVYILSLYMYSISANYVWFLQYSI